MKLKLDYNEYRAKIYAGWMGKSLGGTIGARMENHKTRMNLTHEALWPEVIMPNDDMDIQIVWLEALQERGIWIESDDLAEFWKDRCWYNFCEYGVFLNNWQRGIHPPLSGTWNNRFFVESEGCPIRSEIWGLVCPGNPRLAAEYARKDAQLDHGGASELCEMFLSAAAAAAFFDDDLDRVLDAGLAEIPDGSVVHYLVNETRAICVAHPQFDDAWRLLVRRFGDRDASKAMMNQAIAIMALILGRGNFSETMRLAVNSGWDTDCSAATAGALLGIMHGSSIFPKEWVDKMGKTLACGIEIKHKHATFEALTDETAQLGVEIAHLRGDQVEILHAPKIQLRPRPEPGVKMGATYPADPWLRAEQNTPIRLQFKNTAATPQVGTWRLEAPARLTCSCTDGTLSLAPGESVAVELQVAPQAGPLWDKNLLILHWEGKEGGGRTYKFGLGGARLWRVYGPYFDMWDTAKNTVCPYSHDGIFTFPHSGDSWNHYARLDHPYLDEARLLKEDIPEELPEQIQAGEDYLEGTQIAGFRGQACFYLVRELVAEEPRDAAFHITSSAPLAVWFDGKELVRREQPRDVSIQDGYAGPMNVGPTPKRLVIKLARQIDALSFCAVPVGGGDHTHKQGQSMYADWLGDVPL